ncbi:hypothetical protein FBU59_005952 [Linderina macrospora]|uniref:Uncharacterized protein n=1 Tax=Linderina macrospora TaxID=4868 RepID=A0ACC1J199_9FUNG|nr:hypothetical protein FBU59_005952 [Linderina macrospora]
MSHGLDMSHPSALASRIFDGLSFMITVSEPGAGSSASQDGGVQSRRSTPNYPDVDPARGRSKHSWTKASKAQTMLMSEPLSAKSAVVMDRARLAEWITQRGGTVVASHKKCIEMFDDQKRLEDAGVESNPPNMFLIADKASTTAKYLAALALGIPRVSGVWISECVMNQRLEDHRPFQLSNGWSEELGAMCASTFVEEFLYGTTVMVSGSAQFQNNWCQLLALAGAKTITPPAVLGSRTSSKTPQIVCDFILSDKKPRNGNDSKMAKMCTRNRRLSQQQWNTLAVESGSPLKDYGVDDGISTVLAKSSEDSIGAEADDHELAGDADGSADPWLVSHRWARQCLINQRVLRFNGHPSYVEYS